MSLVARKICRFVSLCLVSEWLIQYLKKIIKELFLNIFYSKFYCDVENIPPVPSRKGAQHQAEQHPPPLWFLPARVSGVQLRAEDNHNATRSITRSIDGWMLECLYSTDS